MSRRSRRGSRLRSTQSSTWLLLVLAIATAVVLVVAVRHVQDPPPHTASKLDPSMLSPDKPKTVVAFGDSYTQGAGASTPEQSWISLLAADQSWRLTNLARGGTGYLQTAGAGACGESVCPNYSQMIAKAPTNAEVVVVAGGRNDVGLRPARVHAAVDAFYAKVAQRFPDAEVVAINPWWDSTKPPQALSAEAAWVKAAVERIGGTFIDTGQPLEGQPQLVAADGVHPNDEGHVALERAVLSALAS